MRRLIPLCLLPASLPAAIFLWHDGFFASSDGMIHLYRLFELDRSLHAGIVYPRWFPLSGYGYGLPVLNYYPPLSYYLAEWFHLAGVGYIAATKLLIAFGFVIAAFSMFIFARGLLGDGGAFVAAVGYAYLPYLLSDAYVRGNFPEFLAMSLLPLALFAFARAFERRVNLASEQGVNRLQPALGQSASVGLNWARQVIDRSTMFAAVVYAAILITHHLTAMLFTALVLAYVLFLFAQQRDWMGLVRCAGVVLLALGLSAFYWLPSLGELNLVYVEPASVPRFLVNRLIQPADFFAPALAYTYLPQSEALTRAPGFPQMILALLPLLLVILSRAKDLFHVAETRRLAQGDGMVATQHRSRLVLYVLFFSLVVAISIFMSLTPSAPLWYTLSPLRFLQFPWRFHVLAGIGIAFLVGVWGKWMVEAASRFKVSWLLYPALVIALIALGVANLAVRVFPLKDANLDLRRSSDPGYVIAQMGWGWTREFVPATVSEFDAIYTSFVKLNPIVPVGLSSTPVVKIQREDLVSRELQVTTLEPFELSLHTFFFPGWQAYVDSTPARTYPRGGLGLMTVNVPPGDHTVVFRFEDTPLRAAANIASIITLVSLLIALLAWQRRVLVALLAVLIVIAGMFAWHARAGMRSQPPTAMTADLEQQIMLIGYSSEREGDVLFVTLHWLGLQEMSQDYSSFAHLIDAHDEIVVQSDGTPDQGLTPTTRWIPGEIVFDRRVISLDGVVAGDYRLVAGMYLPLEDGFRNLGSPIELGQAQIR